MTTRRVLFENGTAISPDQISQAIGGFAYNAAVRQTILDSQTLDRDGKMFVRCTARILPNFGMTRGGVFKGVETDKNGHVSGDKILRDCWKEVGERVLQIHDSVLRSGYSRDRYLLELSDSERVELTATIWSVTKQLLPYTMGKTSHGLVGASKILFAVLPEIVLPVDNSMWLNVFRTVDLGDVINGMAIEIQHWEEATGKKLDELGRAEGLTTLPSVYNVMAMKARPRDGKEKDSI